MPLIYHWVDTRLRFSYEKHRFRRFLRKACCLIVSMHKRHFSDHLDRLNIVLPTLILFTSIFTIPLSRSHAPHQSTNRSNVSKPQKIRAKYICLFEIKNACKMSLLKTWQNCQVINIVGFFYGNAVKSVLGQYCVVI